MTEPRSTVHHVVCLYCDTPQEVQTSPFGAIPKPGDICICYDCGYPAAYGDDLQLVALTSEQQAYVETNAEFKEMMALLRRLKEEDERHGYR